MIDAIRKSLILIGLLPAVTACSSDNLPVSSTNVDSNATIAKTSATTNANEEAAVPSNSIDSSVPNENAVLVIVPLADSVSNESETDATHLTTATRDLDASVDNIRSDSATSDSNDKAGLCELAVDEGEPPDVCPDITSPPVEPSGSD